MKIDFSISGISGLFKLFHKNNVKLNFTDMRCVVYPTKKVFTEFNCTITNTTETDTMIKSISIVTKKKKTIDGEIYEGDRMVSHSDLYLPFRAIRAFYVCFPLFPCNFICKSRSREVFKIVVHTADKIIIRRRAFVKSGRCNKENNVKTYTDDTYDT